MVSGQSPERFGGKERDWSEGTCFESEIIAFQLAV